MTARNRRKQGFTLLELLVVIAILSMLMAILLPSMNRARIQAKSTQCLSRLRSIAMAQVMYIQDNGSFPPLNNEQDDGAWQYNYLIYDGRDFDSNFGPLVVDGYLLDKIDELYCPLQKDPYHTASTAENPWPIVPLLDTRSSYGRRYHLTGKSLSQLTGNPAIAADVFHLPKVVKSAHKNGVNAVYADGHAQFVRDPGKLTDNQLAHPFDPVDNDIVKKLWHVLNKAGR